MGENEGQVSLSFKRDAIGVGHEHTRVNPKPSGRNREPDSQAWFSQGSRTKAESFTRPFSNTTPSRANKFNLRRSAGPVR
jgi:hypothetical protein